MPRWVRSHWDDGDVTFLMEVSDDGWITRQVEQVGAERCPQAAAALDEVVAARDTGGILAVQAYERRFGVAPEKPLQNWNFPHRDIDKSEFEDAWVEARAKLEPRDV